MTKVYLIRHAEAEGNVFRRGHGHYNSYITSKGHRQIAALAERFKDVELDALYSSDLRRTVTTAGAITKYHKLQIQTDPRLRELSLGDWEDCPWGNLEHESPENMWFFNNDPEKWSANNGESYAALQSRMLEAVREHAAENDGKTIACVSHGMAIRALVCKILGISSDKVGEVIHGDNTSVTLLLVDGDDMKFEFISDNSHLSEDLSTFARQSWWREENSLDEGNIRLESFDPSDESELYLDCYAGAWRDTHGSLEGFTPMVYLSEAKAHYAKNKNALVKAMMGERVVGIIDLDTARGEKEGFGWISLIYVLPFARRQQLGVQLLGHAVTFFRARGMKTLRLNVSEDNTNAISFYKEYLFSKIGETQGILGQLMLMEKEL